MSEIKDVIVQGLWKNNSALVQLLGLCPLLAVTSTATNALGLGLATTLVLTLTNLTISTLRHWTPAEIYPLPTSARQNTAVDRILHNLFNRMTGTDRGFKCIQRCRLTNAINT